MAVEDRTGFTTEHVRGGEAGPPHGSRQLRRLPRSRALTSVLLSCVVLLAVGFAAGRFVRSPADAAAERAPTVVETYATASARVVAQDVTLRGTVAEQQVVTVPAYVPAGVERAVVTRGPAAVGTTVSDGQLLAALSDRPLFAVSLGLPLFRPLRYGDTGSDVAEVQAALVRLGFASSSPDGELGPATQAALARMYAASSVPTAPVDPAVVQAAQAADEAYRAAAATPAPADPAAVTARDQLEDLRTARDEARGEAGPWLPLGEWFAVQPGTVVSASANGGQVLQAGDGVVDLSRGTSGATGRADAVQVEQFTAGSAVTVVPLGSDGPTDGVQGSVTDVGPFTVPDGAATDPNAFPGHDVNVSLPQDSTLVAGTVVSIRAAGTTTPSLAVPLTAIRQDSKGTYVLVPRPASADGAPAGATAHRRVAVVVERQADGYAALEDTAGLPAGTRVATTP